MSPLPKTAGSYPQLETLRHNERRVVAELATRVEEGALDRLHDAGGVVRGGGDER
jgi:hypothetical protein